MNAYYKGDMSDDTPLGRLRMHHVERKGGVVGKGSEIWHTATLYPVKSGALEDTTKENFWRKSPSRISYSSETHMRI